MKTKSTLLFLRSVFEDFSGASSPGFRKNWTQQSSKHGQAAHEGKGHDGINTRHLNHKRGTSSAETTGYGHHTHSTIPKNNMKKQLQWFVMVNWSKTNFAGQGQANRGTCLDQFFFSYLLFNVTINI